jgi:hypothetical protein
MDERLRAELDAAVSGARTAVTAADRLCAACVELLEVDGASISLTLDGTHRGTFGASSPLSRRLDEFQFTAGEGPCLDAVATGRPVLVPDLDDPAELRWPGFTGAVLDAGIRAVFALPVTMSTQRVGALDLYRARSGALTEWSLSGGLLAAELAALPLLDMIAEHQTAAVADAASVAAGQDDDAWSRLASLERVEVYQATGMIMGALGVDGVEALVRLRAQAFLRGTTAGELAWEVVERRVSLDSPDWQDPSSPPPPP